MPGAQRRKQKKDRKSGIQNGHIPDREGDVCKDSSRLFYSCFRSFATPAIPPELNDEAPIQLSRGDEGINLTPERPS